MVWVAFHASCCPIHSVLPVQAGVPLVLEGSAAPPANSRLAAKERRSVLNAGVWKFGAKSPARCDWTDGGG
jgi:hypothetical protein